MSHVTQVCSNAVRPVHDWFRTNQYRRSMGDRQWAEPKDTDQLLQPGLTRCCSHWPVPRIMFVDSSCNRFRLTAICSLKVRSGYQEVHKSCFFQRQRDVAHSVRIQLSHVNNSIYLQIIVAASVSVNCYLVKQVFDVSRPSCACTQNPPHSLDRPLSTVCYYGYHIARLIPAQHDDDWSHQRYGEGIARDFTKVLSATHSVLSPRGNNSLSSL